MSKNIDLISDLETDLVLAFLVDRRFIDTVRTDEALALIDRVKNQLDALSKSSRRPDQEKAQHSAAH